MLEIGEVSRALDETGDSFESHARIDMLRRKRCKGSVGVRIELDEDQVPNLDALRRALVYPASSSVTGSR